MTVTWLVSPNGLGHATRATELAAALVRARPGTRIRLALERWQLERLSATAPIATLRAAGTRFHEGLLAHAPRWPVSDPARDLVAWRDEVATSGVLDGAGLVVSDNLAGVLALAPDAILCGSFLWSDVLAPLARAHSAIARFVDDERTLLAAHRPVMVCNADLAMPGVLARTRAVAVPWMGERRPRPTQAPTVGVALLGGASGAADEALMALARELGRRGVPLALSKDLARRTDAPPAAAFDHSSEAYANARLLVCRPGVGTLTRAIATARPIAFVPEQEHVEMAHNGAKIEALDVGVRLPALDDPGQRADAICALLADDGALAAMTAASIARPTGGLPRAVGVLIEALDQRAADRREVSA